MNEHSQSNRVELPDIERALDSNTARALLIVIDREPAAVARALGAQAGGPGDVGFLSSRPVELLECYGFAVRALAAEIATSNV